MTNILITGGSGYLGGDLLHYLSTTSVLPASSSIYALVRTDEQADSVRSLYNAIPIRFDLSDQAAITEDLVAKRISIVFYLVDAFKADGQLKMLKALNEVGSKTGLTTHFLHTSGAKLFSGFVGFPTQGELGDNDANMFDMQNTTKPELPLLQTVQYHSL